jgi:hypothetical protein
MQRLSAKACRLADEPAHRIACMNWQPGCVVVALALAGQAHAQAAPRGPIEPRVEVIVFEDDGARIEELRVRGLTQRILVTPRRGVAVTYEIITGDGSGSQNALPNATRGAVGQRVWHVLSF